MQYVPKGILPAVVTPLTPEGRVSEKGLRKLVNYLIEGGIHGLFVVGTTGEFYGLSLQEKKVVVEIAMDEAKGRVPTMVGTGAITTRECILLNEMAEECGADAVSVLTPMFINPSQEELYRHYKTIAGNTGLPVLLYNNPSKTGVNIAAATAARLAEIPNIRGIKDSSGDLTLTGEYIRMNREKDFSVLGGRDTLIHACLCYGGSGAIAATANVAPRLCADIYDKYMAGDLQGSLEAQFSLAPLRVAFSLGTFPTVIKEALGLLGIDAGPCLAPVGTMSPSEKEKLRQILEGMGLLG